MYRPNRYQALLISFIPKLLLRLILERLPIFKFIKETSSTQVPIRFNHWYNQFILRHYPDAHWPVHLSSTLCKPENIFCGIETSPGYMPCCYIQAYGEIVIGDYTQIASNVGIISANHELHDTRISKPSKVLIGKYGWIGMNSCILPGVTLGDFTVVGAGSVVTKSFPEGYCLIAGNPAKIVKKLDKNLCVPFKSKFEYRGYIPAEQLQGKKYL